MDDFVAIFKKLYNVQWLVSTVGYSGMALIIFVETGLLFGFFLPGDSLLFIAGFACAPDNALLHDKHLSIIWLNLILIPAAILGDTVGYWIGFKTGISLYAREKTLFFRRDHLLKTKAFYEKHGGKTIVIARFVPLIRTFAPVVAGIAQMPYREFLMYNVFGGVGWVLGLSTLGYYLGQIKWISDNLDRTIIVIIFISLLPALIVVLKEKYLSKNKNSDTQTEE